MTRPLELSGQRFEALSVIGPARTAEGRLVWECRCDCGATTRVVGTALLSGKTRSCGCRRKAACARIGARTAAANSRAGAAKAGASRTRHGRAKRGSKDPTYLSWEAMHARCSNPKNVKFHRYGGRGIRVCERWSTFENFLQDMGERPQGKTLDRYPHSDGNYEPGNCRWATPKEQADRKGRIRNG